MNVCFQPEGMKETVPFLGGERHFTRHILLQAYLQVEGVERGRVCLTGADFGDSG